MNKIDPTQIRPLRDDELGAVSGGDARTDPGDDMSGGELAALILLGAGAVAGILYP